MVEDRPGGMKNVEVGVPFEVSTPHLVKLDLTYLLLAQGYLKWEAPRLRHLRVDRRQLFNDQAFFSFPSLQALSLAQNDPEAVRATSTSQLLYLQFLRPTLQAIEVDEWKDLEALVPLLVSPSIPDANPLCSALKLLRIQSAPSSLEDLPQNSLCQLLDTHTNLRIQVKVQNPVVANPS